MSILSRLIAKRIWTLPKLWEGFVRVAVKTAPHSYSVLLQLPPVQLGELLTIADQKLSTAQQQQHGLRAALTEHVKNFNSIHRAQVPRAVLNLLGIEKEKKKDKAKKASSTAPLNG